MTPIRPLALTMLSAVVVASPATAADVPPARSIQVTVFGDDPCPRGQGDEIVVCARRPDNERYRIPKELRKKAEEQRRSETAWGARVAGLEDAQRSTRPGSCSPVGSWGQTGCWQKMISQWYAERRAIQAEKDSAP
jgi:hypothetical protein